MHHGVRGHLKVLEWVDVWEDICQFFHSVSLFFFFNINSKKNYMIFLSKVICLKDS